MQTERLLNTFLELVRRDNPSGAETPVVDYVRAILEDSMGLHVEQDDHLNLLAHLAGEGEPILLNAHTDSVQPCINVRPVVANGVVRSSGDTVLGADDLAGVAAILEGIRRIRETGTPNRAAEILFTAQEEIGLQGAKAFDYSRLQARQGFTFDMTGEPGSLCLGGPSQANLKVTIHGKAAHAGIAPEEGISAIQVAAEAITAMSLGRIDEETTANIGVIRGGEATNIVTPQVELRGETRSHNPDKLETQVHGMVEALEAAAQRAGGHVDVTVAYPYRAYRLQDDEPIVQQAVTAWQRLGVASAMQISGGGSDVNIFAAHGLRVVNVSTGYQDIHTCNEHIAVADLERLANLVTIILEA